MSEITFEDFRNTVLGLRYIDPKFDSKNIKELYDIFNIEIKKIPDIVSSCIPPKHDIQNVMSKDQYSIPSPTLIIDRPVEIDLSLAYANTIKILYPEFIDKIKYLLEKASGVDPNIKRLYKFLINYSIGLLFKTNQDFGTEVRHLVIIEVDQFLRTNRLMNYVIQKKRDGVLLDLPTTFMVGNLKEDSRFKVTEYKFLMMMYGDEKKQLYLTKSNDIFLKGIGTVPYGILNVYKLIINTILMHGTNTGKMFHFLNNVVNDFLTKFDENNFIEPISLNQYELKLSSGLILTVTNETIKTITRGLKVDDIDIDYYYSKYIKPWIQTVIANTNM